MFHALNLFELSILDSLYDAAHSLFLDRVTTVLSFLGDSGAIFIVLGCALLFFKRTRITGVIILTSLIFSLLLVNLFFKPVLFRERPFMLEAQHILLVPPLHDGSFPSGHTSVAFASAVSLLSLNRKRWFAAAVAFALLMGFSRLYLYMHYPTDVAFGALCGALCGWLSIALWRKILLKAPSSDIA